MSSRNMQDVSTLGADSLNILEIMKAQSIVIPVSSLSKIEELYAKRDGKSGKAVKKVTKKKVAKKKVEKKKVVKKKVAAKKVVKPKK